MFSKPLAYPSTLDRRFVLQNVVLRGGALEPDPCSPNGNSQAKADAYSPLDFQHTAAEIFLSQAGPRFDLELFQAEHHLLFDVVWPPSNKKGDPLLGRPRLACFCG
jgi:hypothetical protein